MFITFSAREFNKDPKTAKKAAKKGPVFIVDRGRPTHVLLTIEGYQKLIDRCTNIINLLAMPGVENIEFEAPRLGNEQMGDDFWQLPAPLVSAQTLRKAIAAERKDT